jgi:hypothetical protein
MPTSSIPASGGGGLQPKYQKFTSSGTFTLPDGYGAAKPLLINIQVIGGGGGGGGSRQDAFTVNNTSTFRASRTDYFGDGAQFNSNAVTALGAIAAVDKVNTQSLTAGGSGGIAQTQMYLTGNLTITVGAAGARPAAYTQNIPDANFTLFWKRDMTTNGGTQSGTVNSNSAPAAVAVTGGTGGISTAGAVSATGGTGGSVNAEGTITASINNFNIGSNGWTPSVNSIAYSSYFSSASQGTAGQPAGTAGIATPLLGALAGGAAGTTPVYGAFGVGGIKTDGATHTGVEGTGGGFGSIGASGAVIITWWQ